MASVSVIIPTKNNADTIRIAIESCLSDCAVGEVIVVVQPSQDATRDVALGITDPRLSVVEDEGHGISRAMNIGMTASSCAYLAKVDGDDIVPKGRFDSQCRFLNTHPEIMAVCGAFAAIDNVGQHLSSFATDRAEGDVTEQYLAQERPTHLGSWLCRREAWEEVGGFREWFVIGEDVDMAFRLAILGRVWFIPDVSYLYRISEGSITRTHAKTLRDFYDAQSSLFARQRIVSGTDDLEQHQPPPVPVLDTEAHEIGGAELHEQQTVGFLEARAWREFHDGRRRTAFHTIIRSSSYAKGWRKLRQVRSLLVMIAKTAIARK
nr:glycosyltransferase family A protein [Ruegeria sp. R13_0]